MTYNMHITAIIEKGPDGLYSVYSNEGIGKMRLGGYGESVEEAKDDFHTCIREAFELNPDVPVEDADVEYHYDIQSFFNYFDYINGGALARYIGINESQLRQYKNGLAYPNEKTTRKILDAIHTIGRELLSASL